MTTTVHQGRKVDRERHVYNHTFLLLLIYVVGLVVGPYFSIVPREASSKSRCKVKRSLKAVKSMSKSMRKIALKAWLKCQLK